MAVWQSAECGFAEIKLLCVNEPSRCSVRKYFYLIGRNFLLNRESCIVYPDINTESMEVYCVTANREYKDSVFSLYLSDPERLIDVYNAVADTDYPPDTPVEINTLTEVLYKNQIKETNPDSGAKVYCAV